MGNFWDLAGGNRVVAVRFHKVSDDMKLFSIGRGGELPVGVTPDDNLKTIVEMTVTHYGILKRCSSRLVYQVLDEQV